MSRLEEGIKKIPSDYKSLSFAGGSRNPLNHIRHPARICHQGALDEKGKAEGRDRLVLESHGCSSHWGHSASASGFAALRYTAQQAGPFVTPAPAVEAVSCCVSWCLSAFRSLPCDSPNLAPSVEMPEGGGREFTLLAGLQMKRLPADFSQ